MISIDYTVYCDSCANGQPLVSQGLVEACSEAMNLGWTAEKIEGTDNSHWYCPSCSLRRVDQKVNG